MACPKIDFHYFLNMKILHNKLQFFLQKIYKPSTCKNRLTDQKQSYSFGNKMKQLLLILALAFSATALAADSPDVAKADAVKTKQVCKDVLGKDNKPVKNKDGSVKQQCKTIKIHKKHEGTEIPPKK